VHACSEGSISRPSCARFSLKSLRYATLLARHVTCLPRTNLVIHYHEIRGLNLFSVTTLFPRTFWHNEHSAGCWRSGCSVHFTHHVQLCVTWKRCHNNNWKQHAEFHLNRRYVVQANVISYRSDSHLWAMAAVCTPSTKNSQRPLLYSLIRGYAYGIWRAWCGE